MGFTDEQTKVIDSRNKNLIVSAAAGSGKTSVLTERIVEKVLSDVNLSIDRMLIVTFTNAAAREMRDRIGKRLREKLAENPGDPHIRKQIAILHTAQITTIDSFCLFILKNHFEEIGVDPAFTIGSEGEIKAIADEAFDEAVETALAEGDADFMNLVEMYAPKGKFKKLYELVKSVAAKVDSSAYPYDTLNSFIAEETDDIWDMPFTKIILDFENEFLEDALEAYREVRDLTAGTFLEKHFEEACAEISFIEGLLDGDLRYRIRAFNAHDKIRLAYGRRNNTPEEDELKAAADAAIKRGVEYIDKYTKQYKGIDEEDFAESVKEGFKVTNSLVRFVESYMRLFDEKKRDNGIISFSDMEHMALEILVKKEGDKLIPTETARRYREYFDEVMIDEYQDSNYVQETILSAVSREEGPDGNRFMVGDIKQSIYGFRLAKPEIFDRKCEEYSEAKGSERINLTINFRSRQEVIDSVNYVFERLMKQKVGGVEYDDAARLRFGQTNYEEPEFDARTELLYFSKSDFNEIDKYKDFSNDQIEAALVASKIREILDSKAEVFDPKTNSVHEVKCSDIAILLRSMSNGRDVIFQNALKEEGIPGYVISKAGYYSAWEVQLILSFLSIIDNPRQDMPLLGVLHSFIGGFNEDEIALISAESRRVVKDKRKLRLIDSLYQYILIGSDEELKNKVIRFTDKLEDLRKQSVYMSASDMLQIIFEKYDYPVMISSLPGGEQRLANIKLLTETADEYEEQGIFGIHDFVKYTEKLKARQDMGEANLLDENADVVRILTIHKSKGLEFPICFLSGLHSEFMGSRDTVLMDDEKGMIGGDTFNLDKRIKGVSPVKRAIAAIEKRKGMGEEIRVLYVGMTRAREKLIMTGMLDEDPEAQDELSAANILKAKSFIRMIYPIVKEKDDLFDVQKVGPEEFVIKEVLGEAERISKIETIERVPAQAGREEFVYPHDSLDGLFVKTTVSELKKAAYLEREDGENSLYHEEEKRVPGIVAGAEYENGGARRGSAYHRVMELMDFEHIYEGDVAENLREHRKKMVDNLFIYAEDDALVRSGKIREFLDTELSHRMSEAAKAGKLYLEQPFVLSVNAHEVNETFPDTEKVLVQGVIDVYFEEDGRLILMDYKTDRVDSGEELIARYKMQLDYYAEALSRLEKKPVAEILIYSFALGEVIKV